jgi:hypothetical protein
VKHWLLPFFSIRCSRSERCTWGDWGALCSKSAKLCSRCLQTDKVMLNVYAQCHNVMRNPAVSWYINSIYQVIEIYILYIYIYWNILKYCYVCYVWMWNVIESGELGRTSRRDHAVRRISLRFVDLRVSMVGFRWFPAGKPTVDLSTFKARALLSVFRHFWNIQKLN